MTDASNRKLRLWARVGVAGVAGFTAALMSFAAHAQTTMGAGSNVDQGESRFHVAQAAQSGDDSEMVEASDPGTDDAAFLTLLGLVEGHLRAGIELYRQGAADMAKTHMKHPGDELYMDLEPALAVRNLDGFARPLERLAVAVEGGEPVAAADEAFQAVLQDIGRTRTAAGGDLAARLQSVTSLVRTAAEEYEIAVKEGRVADPHEYQDAWGFVQAAKAQMAGLGEADRQRMGPSFDEITAELDGLDKAWPAVVPPDSVTTDAGLLYAAADRIARVAQAVE
ncbi:MAG: hypothetical protein ACOC9Q_00500 [bacterium]